MQLLANIARSLNLSKVLLGDCGNVIAVRLLSSMTRGAGASIANEAVSRINTRLYGEYLT